MAMTPGEGGDTSRSSQAVDGRGAESHASAGTRSVVTSPLPPLCHSVLAVTEIRRILDRRCAGRRCVRDATAGRAS